MEATKKTLEKIIKIIGFGIEPEVAELMAQKVLDLFDVSNQRANPALNDYGIKPCAMYNVVCNDFTQEQWRKLASIIDADFIGSDNTFTSDYEYGYYYLTTNKCDSASFLKVFTGGIGINKITILGEHTEGWVEIRKGTYKNIKRSLNGWLKTP